MPDETPEQLALYGESHVDVNIVLTRLMNSGTEQKVVEAALVLMLRAVAVVGLESLTPHNSARLTVAALIVANMMFEDDVVYLSRWQKMSQICWTLQEIRYFTIELMVLLDYRLNV